MPAASQSAPSVCVQVFSLGPPSASSASPNPTPSVCVHVFSLGPPSASSASPNPTPSPYPYQSAVGTIERSPGWQPGEHDPPMEMSPVRDGRKHIQSRMPGNISIPPRTSRGLLQKHVVGPCCRTAAPPGGPAWSCHSVGAAPRGRPPLPNSIQISITWQILVILAKNTSCCFL